MVRKDGVGLLVRACGTCSVCGSTEGQIGEGEIGREIFIGKYGLGVGFGSHHFWVPKVGARTRFVSHHARPARARRCDNVQQ